jgi:trehalose 6-phosphate phosphatase
MIWDRPLALFLDVDGTLLDISRRPQEVVVPEGLRSVLESTWRTLGGALALVSGRAIADLDRLFAPLRLPAAGQHGAELRLDPDGRVCIMPGRRIGAALRQAVEALAHKHPGVELEDKGMTLAVHYRAAPEIGRQLARELRVLLAREGEGIALCRGKMVLELRDLRYTKAGAVEAFLRQPSFAGRLPVFVGDDITDEDGFAAVERHGGIAMPVGRACRAANRRRAIARRDRRLTFAGPADVRKWLATLAPGASLPPESSSS